MSYIQRHLAPKKLSSVNRLWLNVLAGINRQAQYITLWTDNAASEYHCQFEAVVDWNKCAQAPASTSHNADKPLSQSQAPAAVATPPAAAHNTLPKRVFSSAIHNPPSENKDSKPVQPYRLSAAEVEAQEHAELDADGRQLLAWVLALLGGVALAAFALGFFVASTGLF